jgi:hypothetical protein
MAWTAPRTAAVGDVFTASWWNGDARDSLNVLNTRLNNTATVTTGETTTSTTFTDLATVGPTVSSLTTGTFALVFLGSAIDNNTAGSSGLMSVDVSGATTTAASDANSTSYLSPAANQAARISTFVPLTLTAGSNTFKAKYRVTANTGTFTNRKILVLPVF